METGPPAVLLSVTGVFVKLCRLPWQQQLLLKGKMNALSLTDSQTLLRPLTQALIKLREYLLNLFSWICQLIVLLCEQIP